MRGRLALAGIASLVALAGAELALRVLERGSAQAGLRALHEARPEREWLYGLRPGAERRLDGVRYRINEDGFRDPPRERPKPDGVFRIAVLGDSLTFGYGVRRADAFPARLERALRARAPIEVLNLGVSGYNPYTEAALLRDVGADYDPDLVLVQFCINDLNDPALHFDRSTRLALGTLPDAAFPGPRRPPPEPGPCQRLHLCARLTELLGVRADRAQILALAAAVAPLDAPRHAERWEWLRARYREMARAAAGTGAAFGVIAFPYEAQLARQQPEYAQQTLRRMAEDEGWLLIDLLPAFRAQARAGDRELLFDIYHPTAFGHELAAAEIGRALARQGLLPR